MPKIEKRLGLPYVARRAIVPLGELATRVPAMTAEVLGWLERHHAQITGKPFVRYRVVDMPDRLSIDAAVPVGNAPRVDDAVLADALPAGRYATHTFTGVGNGVSANQELIHWIADQGEEIAVRKSSEGDVFESRYETTLTDTRTEPRQERWETEIAIRLRD